MEFSRALEMTLCEGGGNYSETASRLPLPPERAVEIPTDSGMLGPPAGPPPRPPIRVTPNSSANEAVWKFRVPAFSTFSPNLCLHFSRVCDLPKLRAVPALRGETRLCLPETAHTQLVPSSGDDNSHLSQVKGSSAKWFRIVLEESSSN